MPPETSPGTGVAPVLVAREVTKVFAGVTALREVTVVLRPQEILGIIGPNGAGKTTLFNVITGIFPATRGAIELFGQPITGLSTHQIARLGVARTFQNIRLFREMTVLENVYLPALCLDRRSNFRKHARDILDTVGLGKRLNHYPNEVSGGEQQRAAIARALINSPKILFADEPTASLDITSAQTVLELFKKLNWETGQTIVMVTHEPEDRRYVDRVIWLKDGLVEKLETDDSASCPAELTV